ncbi:MAG: alkaline phosphatase [Planctomycetota bacterium]
MLKKLLFGVFVCVLVVMPFVSPATTLDEGPRNVIILIGDGMGFEHVKAAGMYANGSEGTLSFESMPHRAEMTTDSADGDITDSAAGGTAIATGYKVNNGVISKAIPSNDRYSLGENMQTLMEYYKLRGRATGLVSTTYISHATPASFAAHQPSRNDYAEIIDDYLNKSRPEVLMGGAKYVSRERAESAGYTVVTDRDSLTGIEAHTVGRLWGQFGEDHMPYEYDGPDNLPQLSEMTAAAISLLEKGEDGFFLMVEGGRIDHASHANDIERTVTETVEFANTVQVVMDWAAGRSDTLVLVTSDHETGGLEVLSNGGRGEFPEVSWSSTGHTSDRVPVYAWGRNAERVSGVMDNTDLFAIAAVGEPASVSAAAVLGICGLMVLRRRGRALTVQKHT